MVAKRSAAGERTRTINQARALILTGPDDLRARLSGHTTAALVAELASLRPRPGSTVGYATRIALRELGRRAEFPGRPARAPRRAHRPPRRRPRSRPARPVRDRPPHRGAAAHRRRGPPRTTAQRGRLGAPVRRRPHPGILGQDSPPPAQPGGDRQANHALWRIVFTRLGSDPATRAYAERRTAEGKSKKEIIRCLKRYVAREVYPHLRTTAG
jgi:transposase